MQSQPQMRVIAQKGNGSFMSARGKKTALVMQDGKMAEQGEMVPLEVIGDSNQEFLTLLTRGLRFLRSGCSGVQILITSTCFDFGLNREKHRSDVMDVLDEAIQNLQDNGREVFKIQSPLEWRQGSVITITRRVLTEPAIRLVTYGTLESGKQYLGVEGQHFMKLANGKGSVRMDGSMAGVVREPQFCPKDYEIVQEILE